MSPDRAKTLRLYTQIHAALANPVAVSYRALKRYVTRAPISGKAKGKLYQRIAAFSRQPVFVRATDGAGELRMAGLAPERDNLAVMRRKHPQPDDAVWELQVQPDPMMLHRMGLPIIRYVIPLG